MYLPWRHGPLTVAEVHRLSPEHNLTATIERSPATPGRPPERYFPRVDYQAGLEFVVQEFLADYLFNDPVGLFYLAATAQQRFDAAAKSLPAAKTRANRQLAKPS